MLGLLDTFVFNSTINTALVIGFSFVIAYCFVIGKKKVTQQVETKERGIKKNTENDSKPIENENSDLKEREVKSVVKTEASAPKVAQPAKSTLVQYEATVAKMAVLSNNYIKKQFPKKIVSRSFLEDHLAEVEALPISDKFAKVMENDKLSNGEKVQDQFVKEGEFVKEDDTESDVTREIKTPVDTSVDEVAKVSEPVQAKAEPHPTLVEFNATEATTLLESKKYVDSMPKAPKPFLASFNTTEAITLLESQKFVASMPRAPRPFLASFNATEALILSESKQYVASMPKAPKPFLADFNATEALILSESKQYVASMPKAPRPFLASFNATEALILSESKQYVASMPKAPKPFLADFNATEAITLLESKQFIASMPKAPKPFLASFNATEAMVLSESKQYVASMPKAPKPFLADFNTTEAMTLLESQQYVASMPKAPKPFLAEFNATEASIMLVAQKYIASIPKTVIPVSNPIKVESKDKKQDRSISTTEVVKGDKKDDRSISIKTPTPATCKKSNLATVDATNAYQLLLTQNKSQQKDTSDSDVEVEIEEEITPATTPSISTSSLHSDATKAVTTPDIKSSAPVLNADTTATSSNHFNNYNYPWFVGGNTFIAEPTYMENGVVGGKKQWTREQKIEKQIQSHMPKMKNRCDFWPNCTNKHCKFSHPVTPCRVGDGCPFGKRCSFIHPKDYVEPIKRRHTTSDATGRKNTYRKPHVRSNSSFTNGKNHTPKEQTSV